MLSEGTKFNVDPLTYVEGDIFAHDVHVFLHGYLRLSWSCWRDVSSESTASLVVVPDR